MTDDKSSSNKIVLLMAGGSLGWAVANALADRFPGLLVIQEAPEEKASIYRRRMRMLGVLNGAGQFAFGAFTRVLGRLSRTRLQEIRREHAFRIEPMPDSRVIQVPSVNSDACRKALREAEPDVVAVYGTRIIRRDTLACVPAHSSTIMPASTRNTEGRIRPTGHSDRVMPKMQASRSILSTRVWTQAMCCTRTG